MKTKEEDIESLVAESIMWSTKLLNFFHDIYKEEQYLNTGVIISSISRFSSTVIAVTVKHFCNEYNLPFEEMKKDIINDFMSLFTQLFNEQFEKLGDKNVLYN